MMSDKKVLVSDKVFRELIHATIDVAIGSNEQYACLGNTILQLEKELLPMLSSEAKEKYLKIDSLVSEQMEAASEIMYRQFYDNYDKFTIILER